MHVVIEHIAENRSQRIRTGGIVIVVVMFMMMLVVMMMFVIVIVLMFIIVFAFMVEMIFVFVHDTVSFRSLIMGCVLIFLKQVYTSRIQISRGKSKDGPVPGHKTTFYTGGPAWKKGIAHFPETV